MMILLAVVFLMLAISTIIIVEFKDRQDEAHDYAAQAATSAVIPVRRMPEKNYSAWPYNTQPQSAAPYPVSAVNNQMPELPEAWSDYLLYQKHSNVEICTLCEDDTLDKLNVGQQVMLTVGCIDESGFLDVVVSVNGTIIGFLPASIVRKEILRKRDMQWHEEAYIDGLDSNGRITLLIGLYSLYNLSKIETERYRLIDPITAS